MTDTDIFFNFSSGYIMGEKKSALDYAFFAMEFMGFFVVLMIAILGATMIAGEYEGGTIKVLAIRPYKRDKIISGKLFATIMFSFIFIMFLGLTSVIIGSIMHGGLDLSKNILAVFSGKALELNPIIMFLIYLMTLFVKTLIFLCPAFLISVCFKSNLGAILFTILIYLLGPFCALFAGNSTMTTFLPFVNIDFYKFTGGEYSALYHASRNMLATPAMPNNHPLIVLMLAVVVISTTLVATYYVFRKRDIY